MTEPKPFPCIVFDRALEAQQRGHLDRAIEHYQHALRLVPQYSDAWNNLGIIAQLRQQWGDAIDCYMAALRTNPRSSAPWGNLGSVLEQVGRLREAVAIYEHGLTLQPRPEVMSNLAGVYRELHRFDKAREMYARALKLAPDHVHIHSALVFTVDQDPASTLMERQATKRAFREGRETPHV